MIGPEGYMAKGEKAEYREKQIAKKAVTNAQTKGGNNRVAQEPVVVNEMSTFDVEMMNAQFEAPTKKRVQRRCYCLWVVEENPPDIPVKNVFGCTVDNIFRNWLMKITSQKWFERFFLFVALADNVLIVLAGELKFGSWFHFTSIGFAALYSIEVILKSWAWGMFGGKMSYWNSNIFNRFDALVAVAAWAEVVAGYLAFDYTIRSIKLYRLLKPLIQFVFFQGLEAIMTTLEAGAIALGTVIYLMIFFFVLFGVAGMELYAGSYSRKCVWADTGQVRVPDRYCKRFDQEEHLNIPGNYFTPGLTLNNNCGPMQVCQDVGALNMGFTNYDNMASAIISVFQSFSTDSQAYVMWAGIQSEPDAVILTLVFYFGIAFILGQILINVFVAVLTTVFSAVREFSANEAAMRADEEAPLEGVDPHVKPGQVLPYGQEGGSRSEPGSAGGPVEDVPLADVLDDDVGRKQMLLPIMPPDAAPKQQKFDFPSMFSKIFRNKFAEAIVLAVILANAGVICTIGAIPEIYDHLVLAEYYFSIFFLVEFLVQVACDGSLAVYFKKPEHNFDFLVQLFTTSALIAQSAGANPDNTALLRSLAIMRLFRACKYFFLRPLWLILIKTAETANSVMNLMIFIITSMVVFAVMGMSLFGDTLGDPRANFTDFGRALLTLFQIFSSDRWSRVLYNGMFSACTELEPGAPLMKPNCTETATVSCTNEISDIGGAAYFCDSGRAFVIAAFYCVFLWLGQHVFVTMFLGLILESFSVEKFMTIERPKVRPSPQTAQGNSSLAPKLSRGVFSVADSYASSLAPIQPLLICSDVACRYTIHRSSLTCLKRR